MFTRKISALRLPIPRASAFFLSSILAAWSTAIFAQGAPTIVRVEEDWTLNVSSPQQGIVAPQLATVISPYADTNSIYAVFAINHRPLPEFAGGGLQLQVWNNETSLRYANFADDSMLNYMEESETITWTQAMAVENGKLIFEILNGRSQTWGEFGGKSLQTDVQTNLTDLNDYSPLVSAEKSGISYAANRVRSLTLSKVRWITSTGQTYEDANAKVVYPQPQP
ncbi:MAG: hypothetical protein IT426_19055 [Pirellulales bacterium]|nr:hypothetical protein [Pirellulales bacterium]